MVTENPIEASTPERRLSPVEILLASLWIILPAVQYVGTYRRAAATMSRGEAFGGFERLDLTPWYVLLLGLTLVYVTVKIFARRSAAHEIGPPE